MNRFDPPGFVDDLSDAQKDQWSQIISAWLNDARAGNPALNDGPRTQFFNPLTHPPTPDSQVATITWNAFPRQVKSASLNDTQRWTRADADRNVQDEYCEWSVMRDPVTSKITRVTFTCEGPEYWEMLANVNPDKVLRLYQEFISPAVKREDIFQNGAYQPHNRFNNSTTRGAMHLIHNANTLGAEIELGAAATLRRSQAGRELTGAQELILCSKYGVPSRNSDPFIGEQVNALARQKADITFNNPIGLYFHELNPIDWVTPDDTDPREFWKFVRGRDGHFVRAVYEVPAARGYVVGDIKIAGRPIGFGAQIADFITMKLEGLFTRLGQSTAIPVEGCQADSAPPADVIVSEPVARRRRRHAVSGANAMPAPPDSAVSVGGADVDQYLIARLPETLRRSLEQAESADDVGAAPPALLPYPKLPQEALAARMVSGKIMAYASPDSTYAVTKKLLDSASISVVVGIYDFSAGYMKEHLKKAMRRGVNVSLMLDTNPANDPTLFNELSQLGANCVKAPSSSAGNPNAYFGHAHEKIIVVDSEIVMIQSGNWSQNSIPFNEGDGVINGQFVPGNRDMGVAVQSRELAMLFAELVARDMRLAQGQPPDAEPPQPPGLEAAVSPAGDIFFETAPSTMPVKLFPSLTVTPSVPVRVTPVITPENFFNTAKAFLHSAQKSIHIEQQYIRGDQATVKALLSEIDFIRQENPELDVRVIVSPKFLFGKDLTKFRAAMEHFHLEFDDNYRFLSLVHFEHCHNKLIVVDGEKVLLGSQNWSTTGVLSNREAGLLVEHAGIAAYFDDIFEADWNMSKPDGSAPDTVVADAMNGVAESTDFAKGGIVISSIRDYSDV